MSNNKEDNFHIGGRSYSKLALEKMAESMTCKPDESGFSMAQFNIDRIFSGEAKTEDELHERLVLTRYFLDTGRPLIREMAQLMSQGITEFLGDSAITWKRPQVKAGNDKEALILMLAIDQVFPRSLHEIAAALGIEYEAAKARKASARRLLKDGIALEEHLQMLTSGLRGISFEDGTKFHLKVYDKNEALDLLEDPSKGERFIRSVIDFFYK